MPRPWFFVCVACILVVFLLLPRISRKADRILRLFDVPDRALSLFALFFGLTILLQQQTGYPYGFMYQVSDNTARIIITQPLVSIYQRVGVLVGVVYWLFLACALFALVSLGRGVYREWRRKDGESDTDRVLKAIQELGRTLGDKLDGESKPSKSNKSDESDYGNL